MVFVPFQKLANVQGNNDHWNIDYVYLADDRSIQIQYFGMCLCWSAHFHSAPLQANALESVSETTSAEELDDKSIWHTDHQQLQHGHQHELSVSCL